MNPADILILVLLGALFCLALFYSLRHKGGCSGCSGCCAACPKAKGGRGKRKGQSERKATR